MRWMIGLGLTAALMSWGAACANPPSGHVVEMPRRSVPDVFSLDFSQDAQDGVSGPMCEQLVRDTHLGKATHVSQVAYKHPGPATAPWVAEVMERVWDGHDQDIMSEAEHARYDAEIGRCAPTTDDCDDACQSRQWRCETEVRRSIMNEPGSSRAGYTVGLSKRQLTGGAEIMVSHAQLCGGPAAPECEPTARRMLFDAKGRLLTVYDSAQGTNSKSEEYYACDRELGGGTHGIDLRGCLMLARDFMVDQRTQTVTWKSSQPSSPVHPLSTLLAAGLERHRAESGEDAVGAHSITQWVAKESGRAAATVTIGESVYDFVLTKQGPKLIFTTQLAPDPESDEGPTRFSCLYER